MAKYRLVEWEDNRYHDSYGKLVYFDDQDGKVKVTEHWSTAYPGEADMSEFLMPTAEIVMLAQAQLADYYFNCLAYDYQHVKTKPTPKDVERHGKVVMNSNFNGRKQGKIAVGTKCQVLRVSISRFAPPRYNNGPIRSDYNVELLTPDGRHVWVNLEKVSLDWDIPTEKETLVEAQNRACGLRFQVMFGGCAWLSTDWASKVVAKSA